MKPKTVFIFFTFFILNFTFFIRLAAGDTWVKTYRPFKHPYLYDKYWPHDVRVTQDNGYVVSGWYELSEQTYEEKWGFLMKTDKDGNMLWASKDSVDFMSFNGYSVEFVETTDGGFLTIGLQDIFVQNRYIMKRDSDGNVLWASSYPNSMGVFSMQNTQDGNIILAGRADYNAALRKTTEDGTTIWTKVIDCGTSIAHSVYECENGDFVLTGVDYDNHNLLIIRTDADGDSLWTWSTPGLGGIDQGQCIIETSNGNVIVGGRIDYPNEKYTYGAFVGLFDAFGDTLWTKVYQQSILYSIGSLVEVSNGFVLQGGKLVKINYNGDILWIEPLEGSVFGGGDMNLQRTSDGGFLCVAMLNHGVKIVLNKTDSLGQVYSIDEPNNQNNIFSLNIYPNPITDYCTISFNNHNISLKDPQIIIYNIKGQLVRELEIENNEIAIHEITWDGKSFDGREVQNGIYFIMMKDNGHILVKKIMKIE